MDLVFVPGEIGPRQSCYDRIEPLTKHPANPVLTADRPWEGIGINYPSVIYSEAQRKYRMWYLTSADEHFGKHAAVTPLIDNAELSGSHFICYAESDDGLSWRKPNVGRYALRGSKENNIVLADSGFFLGCATVVEDPDDPDPRRRFKMLVYDNDGEGRDGARTAVSADGLAWEYVGEFPVLPSQDTPALWHDREQGQFVAFLKIRFEHRRARMVSVSSDFRRWSEPVYCLAPDQADSPTLHHYSQCAFRHRGHPFGFLGTYELSTQRLAVELVTGSSGGDWRRLPGRPLVLAPGDGAGWDGNMVCTGMNPPLRRGREMCYYYNGTPARHDAAAADLKTLKSAVGIATFREGRIVGQQFEGEGWFTSAPFRCPGGELYLDAVSHEPLAAEVWGSGYGGCLAGYERAACVPASGDGADLGIRWKEHGGLDALRGQYVTLRVFGKNAVVYGARVGRAGSD